MSELGLESGRVRVVPYSDAWPALYEAESARIRPFFAAAGGVEVALEHTGSTAVPGLAAKPIVDILAGLGREGDRSATIAALMQAGYSHRGEQGIAGRDFFRRGEPRQYHVHLTMIDSTFWNDHRLFREYLRSRPAVASAYQALKFDLAARYPTDRESYIEGKTVFVRATLASARGEASDGSSAHAPHPVDEEPDRREGEHEQQW